MARPFVDQSSQGHLPEELSTLAWRAHIKITVNTLFHKNNTFISSSYPLVTLRFLYLPLTIPQTLAVHSTMQIHKQGKEGRKMYRKARKADKLTLYSNKKGT